MYNTPRYPLYSTGNGFASLQYIAIWLVVQDGMGDNDAADACHTLFLSSFVYAMVRSHQAAIDDQ